MVFAAGFILFFYLDIFISLHFVAIGMMPMAYLITAVALFVSIVLIQANRNLFDRPERRLNRIWIFLLIVFAVIHFIWNLFGGFFADIFQIDLGLFSQLAESVLCGISSILLFLTLIHQFNTVYYRWQVFCAFSIFIQAVLPVTLWRIMPEKVYRYYGLLQMPMLFGLLMMVDSILKKRFGFGTRDGLRYE
jgi:hypothetical protein